MAVYGNLQKAGFNKLVSVVSGVWVQLRSGSNSYQSDSVTDDGGNFAVTSVEVPTGTYEAWIANSTAGPWSDSGVRVSVESDDALAVHLGGSETITGTKTFAGGIAGTTIFTGDAYFKGRPIRDVCAFGADPTGVAVSTQAFINARNSLPAGGGTVYCSDGTYLVDAATWTTAKDNVLFYGKATIKLTNAANVATSVFQLGNNNTIRDLTFDGNLSNQTAGPTGNNGFLRANSTSDVSILNCTFQNMWGNAIEIQNSLYVNIDGCKFDNVSNGTALPAGQGAAVSLGSGASSHVRIVNCRANNIGFGRAGATAAFGFGNNAVDCIACNNVITKFSSIGIGLGTTGTGFIISGNYIDNGATTTATYGCIDTGTAVDLIVSDNVLYGHNLGGGIINGPPNTNAKFINNYLNQCQLYAGGGTGSGNFCNFIISGNTVHDYQGGSGISVPNLDGAVITGNIVYNCNGSGINLQGSSSGPCRNVVISNNRCYDNQATKTQAYGIQINNTSVGTSGIFTGITVQGNNLVGNGTAGITFPGTTTYPFGANCSIKNNLGFNPVGLLSGAPLPAVPATGVASVPTIYDCSVYITANASSTCAVSIGGQATGITLAAGTTGAFRVPAGQTITLTYTAAPTWKWFGD